MSQYITIYAKSEPKDIVLVYYGTSESRGVLNGYFPYTEEPVRITKDFMDDAIKSFRDEVIQEETKYLTDLIEKKSDLLKVNIDSETVYDKWKDDLSDIESCIEYSRKDHARYVEILAELAFVRNCKMENEDTEFYYINC